MEIYLLQMFPIQKGSLLDEMKFNTCHLHKCSGNSEEWADLKSSQEIMLSVSTITKSHF